MQKLQLIPIIVIIFALLVPVVSADYTMLDGSMNTTFTFTGHFIDGTTGSTINTVHVSDSLGYTTTTTTGTFSTTYEAGTIVFTSSAYGYATTTTTIPIDNDTTTNISMMTSTGNDQVNYYTPHQVRFMCRDYMGAPISGMAVSAVGVQSTLGAVDWLLTLFGINLDSTPITSTLMSGTTGNDGSIVFIMVETEKYKVDFVKAAQGINETRYYYPKEEQYNEIFWTEVTTVSSTVVNDSFWVTPTNATHTTLWLTYNDTIAHTTSFEFFIDNASGERLITQTLGAGSNYTVSGDVLNIPGNGYVWGYVAQHLDFKKNITGTHLYVFENRQWIINPMGAANGDPTATLVYNYAAIGIIGIFALIFGRASVKQGAIIVPLIGALMTYIGWLTTGWFLVTIAIGLGVLIYFRYSEEEAGV